MKWYRKIVKEFSYQRTSFINHIFAAREFFNLQAIGKFSFFLAVADRKDTHIWTLKNLKFRLASRLANSLAD